MVRKIVGSRVGWIVSAASILVVATVVGWLTVAGSADGEGIVKLDCDGGRVVFTMVDHDGSSKEARSPQEQARAWASVEKPEAQGELWAAYRDGNRMELALADAGGRTVALLTYEKRSGLGWIPQSINSCA